jgi:uncharacterized membrane protein YebE (DUF533 family)
MRKLVAMSVLTAFVGGMTASAFAQTKTPVATERQVNQQARIKQGVKSGELNKREAARLEAEQAKIQAEKKAARSDGKVTPRERARIQHDQNKASRRIAVQKHDAQKGQ